MDIDKWMSEYIRAMLDCFGARVRFIGLQGSRARGEAHAGSDIDAVLILDTAGIDELCAYRAATQRLPDSNLLCGFVSGAGELKNWAAGELFQFYRDTVPYYGRLEEIIGRPGIEEARAAVQSGACAIYHAVSHNFLHARDIAALRGIYKSAFFVMRAVSFCRTGHWPGSRCALLSVVSGAEREILELSGAPDSMADTDFERYSTLLLGWTSALLLSRA